MKVYLNENENSIFVESDGVKILNMNNVPVRELKKQLIDWEKSATEENGQSFIFKTDNNYHMGLFRIESRQNGWQFTSTQEIKRSSELLSLEKWKLVINDAL